MVAVVLTLVQLVVADSVTYHARTLEVGLVSVVDGQSVVVVLDAAVGVTDVEGIDGTHVVGNVEYVAARTPCRTVGRRLRVYMRVAHVCADLQPLLHLVVHIQAGAVTLHARVVHNTTVVQVTYAGVVVQTVGNAAERSVVLLTERVVECLVVPVIGRIVVFAVAVTQRSVRVQFEV